MVWFQSQVHASITFHIPHERHFREDEAEVADFEYLAAFADVQGEAALPSVGVALV